MCPEAHELTILWRAVQALAVLDGPLKHVAKLGPCAQVRGPHKVHHAPIFQEVVLQGVAGQHNAPPASMHRGNPVTVEGASYQDKQPRWSNNTLKVKTDPKGLLCLVCYRNCSRKLNTK